MWVKIDVGLFNNQKIVSTSKDAKLIYIAALCHAGATLSDGFIPTNALSILAAQCNVRGAKVIARELVDAGLWLEIPGGFEIHDYLDHNESSQKVRAKQAAARERMSNSRSREQNANTKQSSQNVRANKTRSSREVRELDIDRDKENKNGDKSPTPTATAEPSSSIAPFDVLVTMCEQLGVKAGDLPERERGKQLAVAKRLIADGVTIEDVGALTSWLQDQSWLTGGIDLFTLASQRSKWVLAGKPSAVAQRAPKLPANAHVENRRDEPDLWLKGWGETSSDQANKKVGAA